MNKFDSRITALATAIHRRKMEQAQPVDQLSQSLWEFGRELTELDELGRLAMLAALNEDDPLDGSGCLNLTERDFSRMIGDYSPSILHI